MTTPDISNMNFAELSKLRAAVSDRMKEMRDSGITQLRATIAEQAELLGVSITDLVPKRPRKKRKPHHDGEST